MCGPAREEATCAVKGYRVPANVVLWRHLLVRDHFRSIPVDWDESYSHSSALKKEVL